MIGMQTLHPYPSRSLHGRSRAIVMVGLAQEEESAQPASAACCAHGPASHGPRSAVAFDQDTALHTEERLSAYECFTLGTPQESAGGSLRLAGDGSYVGRFLPPAGLLRAPVEGSLALTTQCWEQQERRAEAADGH